MRFRYYKTATSSVLFAALLSLTTVAHAAVSASLSEQIIDELETVRLTIRASQTRQTETLDLSALESDFHVMGTNTSSQYSFINGRERSWVDYQITLQPKRTGDLTIPSITVGQDSTPTITLTVRPLTDETRKLIDELVFFEQEFSADEVYVQGQLLITRRLLYSNGVQLYSDLPGAPEVEEAVVITLGDPVSSKVVRDGKNYGVVEQRYAVFPELSGSLSIPPISLTASVRLINNGRVTRKGVRVGTQAATISVLAVPAEYPKDQPWIPAKDVQLHQVITPDITEYKVGDTLQYELLVYVEGNLGSIVPPIPLNIDETEFRVYPQSPVIDDDPQRLGVVGSRLQTASVLPLKSGPHIIPESLLTWWDIDAKAVKVARWDATRVNIIGESVSNSAASSKPVDAVPAETTTTEEITAPTSSINLDNINLDNINLDNSLLMYGLLAISVIGFSIIGYQVIGRKQNGDSNLSLLRNQLVEPNKTARARLDTLDNYLSEFFATSPPHARKLLLKAIPDAKPDLELLSQAAFAQFAMDPGGATAGFSAAESDKNIDAAVQNLGNYLDQLASASYQSDKTLPPLYPHQAHTGLPA